MAEKQVSGIDYSRGEGEPIVVKAFLTDEGTDRHAFNKQMPNVGLTIADESAPLTTTNATLVYGVARKLGEALIALADEADQWHYKAPEPNL